MVTIQRLFMYFHMFRNIGEEGFASPVRYY